MALPIPWPLSAAGFAVAIDGIRSSFRWLGFLPGYSRNDLSARLTVYPEQLEVRIISAQLHAYSSVRSVDFVPERAFTREQVVLHVDRTQTTYSVATRSGAIARDLLRFLLARGCSLTPRAHQAIKRSD